MPLKLYSLEGRYASALFTAASKKGELEKVEAEMGKIRTTIKQSEQFQKLLASPTIGCELKKGYVGQLMAKERYSETAMNFFKVLAENGRLSMVGKVLSNFDDLMKAKRGEVQVIITAASVLHRRVNEPTWLL